MNLQKYKITPKLTQIYLPDKDVFLYFSYNELIGYQKRIRPFRYDNNVLFVATNKWSRTTASHINRLKKNYPNHLQTTQEYIYKESGLDESTREEILRQIS